MNLGTLTAILAAVDTISPVVSKLTGNVNAGMGKIKGAIAGAFAIDAIVGAIGKFTEFTGKLTDLSAQTGVGTEKLQAYDRVFSAAGVSIDTVTKSIGEMGKRLIGGDSSAVNALGTLGLKTADLLAMQPDAAFDKISDAIAGIQNPMERATVAQDIFGKGGKDLLAALDGQLATTTQGFIDMGQVIDADTVAAGDNLGDALGELSIVGMNLLGSVLGPFIPALTAIVSGLAQVATVTSTVVKWLGGELMGAFARAKEAVFGFLGSIAEGASKVPLLGSAFEGLGKATDWLKEQAANAGQVLKETYAGMRQEVQERTGPAVEKVSKIVGVYGDNAKAAAEKTGKLEEAVKAFRESVSLMSTVAGNWQMWQPFVTGAIDSATTAAFEFEKEMRKTLTAFDLTAHAMVPFSKGLDDAKVSAKGLGDSLKTNLLGVLQSIPGTIASALQGGGGLGGALKSIASQVGSSIGGAVGFSIGGPLGQSIGSAVGSFAGPLTSALGNLFGKSAGKAANNLRDQIISQAGGFDALAKKAVEAGTSIDALLKARDTKGVQAAADALNAALNGRAEQIALAKAAMEEFGISTDKAGQAFKQAEMDETARSITEKLEAMMSIGVSTEDIIAGAGDEIGAFIHKAIEMGTTVPKEWEPIVHKMIAAGTLIDANGDKFTEMGQVPFAETLNDKIGAVMDKLKLFIDRILDVPDALARIPRNVDVDLNVRRNDSGDGYEQGFAGGSHGIRDFGTGTPVVLHGRERVQTEAQMHAEQRSGGGGGDLRSLIDRLEMVIPLAIRDGMQMAGAR